MVRVTEDPSAVTGTIEAPPQRLATSRASASESGDSSRRSSVDAAIETLTNAKPAVEHTAEPPVLTASAQQDVGDKNQQVIANAVAMLESVRSESKDEGDAEPTQPSPAPQADEVTEVQTSVRSFEPKNEETVGGLVSATLTDLAEPMEATLDKTPTQSTPPQETASVGDLPSDSIPAVSRTEIPRTGQPKPIGEALAKTLVDLPDLPERAPSTDGASPKRIGEPARSQSPTVQTVSHTSAESESSPVSPKALRAYSDDELFEELLLRMAAPGENEGDSDRMRREFMVRHLMVLAGDPENAIRAMDSLGEHERNFLQHQLKALWQVIDPDGHPSASRRFTSTLPLLREATAHLAAATDSLDLRNLVFCTEIESYGKFKPFEGNRFVAGQQVIVYCEVENFICASTKEGFFKTELQGIYDLYDEDGNKVLSQLLPLDSQLVRNPLRDHFVAYQMALSDELIPGTYRLELTLEDMLGKKYGQASVPFEIVAGR